MVADSHDVLFHCLFYSYKIENNQKTKKISKPKRWRREGFFDIILLPTRRKKPHKSLSTASSTIEANAMESWHLAWWNRHRLKKWSCKKHTNLIPDAHWLRHCWKELKNKQLIKQTALWKNSLCLLPWPTFHFIGIYLHCLEKVCKSINSYSLF